MNQTTNDRHSRVGCGWLHAERLASAISAEEMRDDGPELLHPQLPHHFQGPERSFLIVAMSGFLPLLRPSQRRHKALWLAAKNLNLMRCLTGMTVRQAQASARISRTGTTFDGRTSGIICATPSRQPALQNVKVHGGTGSCKAGDRTTYSQSTSEDACGAQQISRISICLFT